MLLLSLSPAIDIIIEPMIGMTRADRLCLDGGGVAVDLRPGSSLNGSR
jgi:hypothetical protein